MDYSGYIVKIAAENDCPCHQAGETFECSGRALVIPEKTFLCMTVAGDLARALPSVTEGGGMAVEFTCSGPETGCAGRLNFQIEKPAENSRIRDAVSEKNIEAISRLLLNLPMFASFDRKSIRRLLDHFNLHGMQDLKFKPFRTGEILLKKGEPGTHLHLIISGRVEVIDEDDNIITTLERGDVFGEMSLISGNPVGATIRAGMPTTVLRLPGKDLNTLLPRYPGLQSFFTQLLAQRLTRTNTDRSQDLSSGMAGRLAEMPPEELLQALNLNRKTGVLSLQLESGPAEIQFKNGDIIHSFYEKLTGPRAVIAIVKNRTGKFKFNPGLPPESENTKAIGNFMGILMNALKEMDENLEKLNSVKSTGKENASW